MGPAWVLYGSDNDDDDNGDDDGDDDGLVLAGGTLLQRSNSSCNSNQLLEASRVGDIVHFHCNISLMKYKCNDNPPIQRL